MNAHTFALRVNEIGCALTVRELEDVFEALQPLLFVENDEFVGARGPGTVYSDKRTDARTHGRMTKTRHLESAQCSNAS